MRRCGEVFVAIDPAKVRNAIATPEAGRQGEVRYLGEFDNTPDAVAKLGDRYETLHFCYKAGPTGYGLYRRSAMEHGRLPMEQSQPQADRGCLLVGVAAGRKP